ncbi:MAG TPA: Asp-tRNA(Asn)/Glu-tRNA(Gln) amidotransferase subunit GatC [Candidatus Aerophobetes bacterium]|uniref:Aspartyl/glutamyl-tRNA(Asn/Gln) amidotransferase subunit C n=1 Tax=Aerophobetes bacterium TaxID=2030807 RepID=A0A662DJE7_UNCAE|nr:MAG: Asp-tRNA(Asn)/Glu-tRNA(Gln) amidotransferase subunit GatB [Candidatus Aerophobetes bacterium]HDN84540.1 Asp-tRNA(Asn)/Glu-tRNA(Gln) amidotransferase subunit GatC [Candidatus Aerophobetes bacterium]
MEKKIIDIEQVRYIAHLSRLELTPEEEEKFTRQLGDILSYVEKLREVDTTNIPPTSHVLPLKNVFREDKLSFSLSPDEALSNAPDRKDNLFKVPKIIG